MFYSCERSSEPRLESKQTTLSSYHCSQHTGFIATLISMATTHSVVSAQQRLSVRACCVSYSTNVLILCYVRQSEESYSWKFNSRLTSSYFEATDAFLKSGFQAEKAVLGCSHRLRIVHKALSEYSKKSWR